ncbi:hypothetical protein D3C86_1821000 [compost metagenome]
MSFLGGLIEEGRPPFDRDIGQPLGITQQLQTLYGQIMHGLDAPTPQNVATALRKYGCKLINAKATTAGYKAWCWRNFDYWNLQKPAVFLSYIKDGTVPADYPKAEESNNE